MGASNWTDILNTNDVDEAWSLFITKFLSVLDSQSNTNKLSRIRLNGLPIRFWSLLGKGIMLSSSLKGPVSNSTKMKLRNRVKYKINKAKSQYYITTVNDNLKRPQK